MTGKILFAMPRSAGDVLCSTSLLRSIKELYPECTLHFATEKSFFDILKDNPERKRLKTVWHDLKAPFNPQIRSFLGKCDYIVHMAAGSHVDRSIEYPMEFVMDNVVGTVNVMDWARSLDGLEKMIYFSTD